MIGNGTALAEAIRHVMVDTLHPSERYTLALFRLIRYGEVTIKLADGLPVFATKGFGAIKLTPP
jgi:hypothetical protein